MYIATLYTTDHQDADLIPDSVIASGEALDDLIPAISDDIAESLVNPNITVSNQYGDPIDNNVASVCQAIQDGTACIVLDRGESRDVFTIIEI